MTDHQYRFLQLMGNLPPRLTPEQTAWLLNCRPHDIPVITAAKLIKPLGNPKSNSVKYYCTQELIEAATDRNWLSRVTNAIYRRRNLPQQKSSLIIHKSPEVMASHSSTGKAMTFQCHERNPQWT